MKFIQVAYIGFQVNEYVPCDDILSIVPTLNGYCYKLSTINQSRALITRPGHNFGLVFELNVHADEYDTQAMSKGVGVQVRNFRRR